MATYLYDPDKVSINFGQRVVGWADGEFVTAEMMTDTMASTSTTDGDVIFSKTMDRRCTVIFKLHQGSPVNAYFSSIMRAVEDTGSAAGIKPLSIKDNTTGVSSQKDLVQGDEAVLQGWPALSRDRGPKMNEWKVIVAKCKRFEPGA